MSAKIDDTRRVNVCETTERSGSRRRRRRRYLIENYRPIAFLLSRLAIRTAELIFKTASFGPGATVDAKEALPPSR